MHFYVRTSYSLSLWPFRDPVSGEICLIGVPTGLRKLILACNAHYCHILAPVGARLPVLRTSGVRLSGRNGDLLGPFRLARVRQLVGLVDRGAVAIAQPPKTHGSGL